MAQRTIGQLDAITTPNDAADVWVQDSGVSPPDRKWSLTNVLAWLRGKFGTAVDSDVQTSLTDTTADRLMKVGAFGLGDDFAAPLLTFAEISDGLDSKQPTGFYRVDDRSEGSPIFDQQVALVNIPFTSSRQIQFAASTSGSVARAWVRCQHTDNTWTTAELLNSNNYPSDTAWTTTTSLDNGWTGRVRYIKRAGWVTVILDSVDGSGSGGDITLLNLSANYRPGEIIRSVAIDGNDATSIVRFSVTRGGNVQVEGTGGSYRGSITHPVL